MYIYILKLYTTTKNKDGYKIKTIGYFTDWNILKFNASNYYKNIPILDKECNYYMTHLLIIKTKVNEII